MATISSRLTNTGTLLVNGSIDEVTFNTTTPSINNKFAYSQDFAGGYWVRTNSVVTANVTLAPDGTMTASKLIGNTGITGRKSVYQGVTITANTWYTYSVYAKAAEFDSVTIWFDTNWTLPSAYYGAGALANLTTATIGGSGSTQTSITSVGNGWYRLKVNAFSSNVTSTNFQIAQGDANGVGTPNGNGSSGIYIWGAQLEQGNIATIYQPIAAANTLIGRANSKQTSDTIYAAGQFDEVTFNSTSPVIKNLLKNTQKLDVSSYWYQGTAATVSANVTIAPDGTLTADKIVQTTTSARHGLQSSTTTILANTAYTVSCFAKAAENNYVSLIFGKSGSPYTRAGSTVNLTTGAISANYANGSVTSVTRATPVNVGNGWWFIALTVIIDATSTDGYVEINTMPDPSYQGSGYVGADSTSGTYVWGVQLEAGTSATIYQPVSTTNTIDTPPARKIDNTGNYYVSGVYDEFTGAPVVDSSLLWWTDAAQTTSYSGTGSQIKNLANIAQTGTMYGNVTYSSGSGGKFVFNNYLDTTNTITAGNSYPTSVNDPWTVEAWMFVPSGATWSNGVNKSSLYLRGSYGGCYGLMRTTNDNQVGVVLRGNTTAQAERYGTTIRNQWNQVVGVWTGGAGGNLQCYVNGTLTQSGTTTQDDPIKQTFWYIGGSNGISGAPGSVLEGNVSGVKLYTRALSADEVAQNFNALRRRYGI